jgi:hypothetical protein
MSDESAAMLEELRAIRSLLESPRRERLLTAAEVARWLSVSENWVYAHDEELRVIRLPSGGQKPRLRFDPELVEGFIQERDGREVEQRHGVRQAVPIDDDAPLLPIRGRGGAPYGS